MPAMIRRIAAALVAAAAAALLAGPAAAQDPLPAAVQAALAQAGVGADALAVMALPLGHGAAPWRHRSEVPVQPGSAMKVVTAVVALDRLGVNATTRTRLLSVAPLEAGVLRGDLVLQGGSDPDFGVAPLTQMLRRLRDDGISTLQGDLVLDRGRYRPTRLDIGEPPFDSRPEGWWNVTPDALLFDGGLQSYEMQADATTFSVRMRPALAGVRLDTSAVTLTDRPCGDWDEDWRTPLASESVPGVPGVQGVQVRFQGAFPRNCSEPEDMQLFDRNALVGLWFAQIWRELGGQWSGGVREGSAPADARELAGHRSRPWGEVLRPLMKTSDNTLTRLLFLELGVAGMAAAPEARTLDIARGAVMQWFAERGIPASGLVLDNGSGLSREERISAHTLARLIEWTWFSRHGADLLAVLPLAGVDGTLRRRITGSPATGVARLKTGTLRNVAALAGVAYDPQGRPWALAAIVNHDIGARARPILDALVDDFARRGPARRVRAGPQD